MKINNNNNNNNNSSNNHNLDLQSVPIKDHQIIWEQWTEIIDMLTFWQT